MLQKKDSPQVKLKNDDATNEPTFTPGPDSDDDETTESTTTTTTTTSTKKDEITTTSEASTTTMEDVPVRDHDHRNQPPSPG